MNENRFALVEWVEGADKGCRSILPISTIRNFTDESESEPKLVEWRSGRKPWPVFRARIVQIAKDEKTLKKKLLDLELQTGQRQLNRKRAPKPNPRYTEEEEEEEEERCPGSEEEEKGPPAKKKPKAKSCRPLNEEEGDDEDGEEEALGGEERSSIKKKTASEVRKEQERIMWETRKLNQMQLTMHELRQENAILKRENDKLKDLLINQIPQMKEDIAFIAGKVKVTNANSRNPVIEEGGDGKQGEEEALCGEEEALCGEERPSTTKKKWINQWICNGTNLGSSAASLSNHKPTQPATPSATPSATQPATPPATQLEGEKDTKIEVLKGSGVFCKKEAYKASMLANTATAMIRTLLLGTFELETLMESNLNGGKPRRGDGEQFMALDPTKKMAIMAVTETIRGNTEEMAPCHQRPAWSGHQYEADRAAAKTPKD